MQWDFIGTVHWYITSCTLYWYTNIVYDVVLVYEQDRVQ